MNFLELVKARYSARKYAGRSVEIEKLEYIMECVRLAPSAVNFQPWRFKIVTDEPTLKALQSNAISVSGLPQLPVSLWLAQTMKSLGIVVPTIKIMQILI